ncbi:MAG: hypothetical protein ACRDD1_17760, partial [Planctomycetia bacterium]
MELWKSDGTASGTVVVSDVARGTGRGLGGLVAFGGNVYFDSTDDILGGGTVGVELWKSDGSAFGTAIVADVNPGGADSAPLLVRFPKVGLGGFLYFFANDGATGTELWKTDGTSSGTTQVVDLRPGIEESIRLPSLTVFGGALYFSAENSFASGVELWRSDGTATGTFLVKDVNSVGGGNPMAFAEVGGFLYFRANDGSVGAELWKSDGTSSGTVFVTDVNRGIGDGDPSPANLNGTLLFAAQDASRSGLFRLVEGTLPPPPSPPPLPSPALPPGISFALNFSPRLDTSGRPPSLEAISSRAGLRVGGLVRGRVLFDSRNFVGVAITRLRAGGAVFERSLNNGLSWRRVTRNLSDDRALLLRPQDRIRLKPIGRRPAQVQLHYRAWNRTNFRPGNFVNVRPMIGMAAFSFGKIKVTATLRAPRSPEAAAVGFAAALEDGRLRRALSAGAVDAVWS